MRLPRALERSLVSATEEILASTLDELAGTVPDGLDPPVSELDGAADTLVRVVGKVVELPVTTIDVVVPSTTVSIVERIGEVVEPTMETVAELVDVLGNTVMVDVNVPLMVKTVVEVVKVVGPEDCDESVADPDTVFDEEPVMLKEFVAADAVEPDRTLPAAVWPDVDSVAELVGKLEVAAFGAVALDMTEVLESKPEARAL